MLRYLRKVQRIFGEFLADMPDDLPYILYCELKLFSSSKPSANDPGKYGDQLACMYLSCKHTKRLLVLLLCDWAEKKKTKDFWHQSEARTSPTVWSWDVLKSLSPGALLSFLDFLGPNLFLAHLDFSPPPLSAPGSPGMSQRRDRGNTVSRHDLKTGKILRHFIDTRFRLRIEYIVCILDGLIVDSGVAFDVFSS